MSAVIERSRNGARFRMCAGSRGERRCGYLRDEADEDGGKRLVCAVAEAAGSVLGFCGRVRVSRKGVRNG
jgi:hypothetical protein